MLNVKKTTYGALSKNNGLLKLTSDIKHAIQKIEEKKNRKNKTINGYAKLIHKKEVLKVSTIKSIIKNG